MNITRLQQMHTTAKNDKNIARVDRKKRAFAFDLQQSLPTAHLTAGKVCYLRQLWAFNLTVHDLVSNEATCFM